MKNLLQNIPYAKLMNDISLQAVGDAVDLLGPMLKEYQSSPRYAAGLAYLLGVKQGVHNERRRRKQTIPEKLTLKERATLAKLLSLDLLLTITIYPGVKYADLRQKPGIRDVLDLADRLNLYSEMDAQDNKVNRTLHPLWDFVGMDQEAIPELPKMEEETA